MTHDWMAATFVAVQMQVSPEVMFAPQVVMVLSTVVQPDWHAAGKSLGLTPDWRRPREVIASETGEVAVTGWWEDERWDDRRVSKVGRGRYRRRTLGGQEAEGKDCEGRECNHSSGLFCGRSC